MVTQNSLVQADESGHLSKGKLWIVMQAVFWLSWWLSIIWFREVTAYYLAEADLSTFMQAALWAFTMAAHVNFSILYIVMQAVPWLSR